MSGDECKGTFGTNTDGLTNRRDQGITGLNRKRLECFQSCPVATAQGESPSEPAALREDSRRFGPRKPMKAQQALNLNHREQRCFNLNRNGVCSAYFNARKR